MRINYCLENRSFGLSGVAVSSDITLNEGNVHRYFIRFHRQAITFRNQYWISGFVMKGQGRRHPNFGGTTRMRPGVPDPAPPSVKNVSQTAFLGGALGLHGYFLEPEIAPGAAH